MISVDWKIALDLAQQRDQGGGLLVGQITPEHGVKGLRDRPKPVEERFAVRREVHQLVAPVPRLSEVDIRLFADTAIVRAVQRNRATSHGHDVQVSTRVSHVWVRRAGAWRLAGIQFSSLVDT